MEFFKMEEFIIDSIEGGADGEGTLSTYWCDALARPYMACLDIAGPSTFSYADVVPNLDTYLDDRTALSNVMLNLSWATSDEIDWANGISVLNNPNLTARYGERDEHLPPDQQCARWGTRGDGIISPLDLTILLWNQFQVAPYNDVRTLWSQTRTVNGENPGGRCTASWTDTDLDAPSTYMMNYDNATNQCDFLAENAIPGYQQIAPAGRQLADTEDIVRLESAIAWNHNARRLVESLPSVGADAQRATTPPASELGITVTVHANVHHEYDESLAVSGVWYRIHVPGVMFGIDLTLHGFESGDAVPLNNQPPPSLDDANVAPVDVHTPEIRFLRNSDDIRATQLPCAELSGSIGTGLAMFKNRIALRQTPTPMRPRVCRYDLFVYAPSTDTGLPFYGSLSTHPRYGTARRSMQFARAPYMHDAYAFGVMQGSVGVNGADGAVQGFDAFAALPSHQGGGDHPTPPPPHPRSPPSPPPSFPPLPPSSPGGFDGATLAFIIGGIVLSTIVIFFVGYLVMRANDNKPNTRRSSQSKEPDSTTKSLLGESTNMDQAFLLSLPSATYQVGRSYRRGAR
jgi:hypothetical protein